MLSPPTNARLLIVPDRSSDASSSRVRASSERSGITVSLTPFTATDRLSGTYTAIQYTDWLTPETATPQANYTGPWHLNPFAAVTRNPYGQGKAWYVGTVLKEPAFYDTLIAQLLKDADIRPVVTPPPGVEVALRQGTNKKLLFLINHTEQSKTTQIPKDKTELLTGQKTGDSVTLDRFGVAVLEL